MTGTARPWRLWLGVGAVVATLAGGAAAWRSARPPEPAPAEAPALDASHPPDGHVGAPGVIEPRDRPIAASVEVAGVVEEVLVTEGQRVLAGDVLLRLRHVAEDAALEAADADVAAAQAELALLQAGARPEEIEAADARVAEADERAAAAEARLTASDAGELDRAEARAAKEAATAAAAAAAVLRAGPRPEAVAAARARLAQAEARRRQAEAALDRLTLRAPIDGEVLRIAARPGEHLAPGPGVLIGDTSVVRARLAVAPADVHRVFVGQTGFVAVDGRPDRWPGRVVEVARQMTADTPTLAVVVELDGEPPLVQGMRVSGFLALGDGAAPPPPTPPPSPADAPAQPVEVKPRAPAPGDRLAPLVVPSAGLPPLEEIRRQGSPDAPKFRFRPGQKVLLPDYVPPPSDGVFGEGPTAE